MADDSYPHGFYPFWFWNDELEADEIRWQIGQMAAQGLRGFFIHPRQGLQQPYLSESFFAMVEVALEAAAQHGLDVHLYDEYPYPSGVAGGELVLGEPRYQATSLAQHTYELAGGQVRLELPRGKVLDAQAFPLIDGQPDWSAPIDLAAHIGMVLTAESYHEGGLTSYNRKRYFASDPTPVLAAELPAGPHRLYVGLQMQVLRHKYWGHFVDVLEPAAVQRFLELTHERYYARFGEHFGSLVKSIFVDETTPHWSSLIPAAFERRHGYDLLAALPALHDASHPEHERVAHDLYTLRYEMFVESFEKPYSEWCRRHGIAYSGEKPSLRLQQLAFVDIPGCDPGHVKAGAPRDLLGANHRANARATASAAYCYGKPAALCECCHSLGWSATLLDAKLIAEGLLLHGITHLVPHGFFYSTHALKKHDAPPSFFFQMPSWPLFGKLSERVDRLGRLFSGAWLNAQVLIVDPHSGLPTADDLECYTSVQQALMAAHIGFLIADTDVLQDNAVEDGALRVRDLAVRAVVVPPMRVVETPLAERLAELEADGVQVIRCQAATTAPEVLAGLSATVAPSLSITDGGSEIGSLQVVERLAAERRLWFVMNPTAERFEAELEADAPLHETPIEDHGASLLTTRAGRHTRVIRPFESFVIAAGSNDQDSLPLVRVELGGQVEVTPQNHNLLRLYDWRLTLIDDDGREGGSGMAPAMPLSNQLEKAGLAYAPTYARGFGHMAELGQPQLHCRYESSFGCDFHGPVELLMEPGSLVGDWTVRINDAPPLEAAAFTPSQAHVRGSLGAAIADKLQRGRNTIRVDLTTSRPDGGLVNALYLAGDFGVTLDPPTLAEPATAGGWERYSQNRLSYYAGAIDYAFAFELDDPPNGPVLFEPVFPEPCQEAVELSVNGGEFIAAPWEPRLVRLEEGALRSGANAIVVRLYTSLVRSFEGASFDHDRHCYADIR